MSSSESLDEGKRVTFKNEQLVAENVSVVINRKQEEETQEKETAKKKKKPSSSPFHQQRLFAYKPVLTPQKAIPFLLFMGLLFIPLGIVFLLTSNSIVEYVLDYTDCMTQAPEGPDFADSKRHFEWRRSGSQCFLRLTTTSRKPMGSPVFLYYQLVNFYQNNRLYAKSMNYEQLMGKPLSPEKLKDCEPLVGPTGDSVYYPCGLVANSFFSDEISVDGHDFSATGIALPYDRKMYGKSKYDLGKIKVHPPKSWDKSGLDLGPDGSYRTLPALEADERFQNWMRISGLSTFRKLYGRYEGVIPERTTLTIAVTYRYDVLQYGGRKAVVLSTASWMGGKNRFLGYAYISFGTVMIIVGLVFLAKHLLSPRMIGDVRYLSWHPNDSTE